MTDVEASIAQTLHQYLKPRGVPLFGQDYLDLMEYLLDVVVWESFKYDPSYGLKFRTVLNWRVRQRTVDWLRKTKHDDRSKLPKTELVDLSELDEDNEASFESVEEQVLAEMAFG